MGLGLRRGESGAAGPDARDRRRGRAQRRARERTLPGTRDGDDDVEGPRSGIGQAAGREPAGTARRIFEDASSGAWADGGGNCAGRAVSVLRSGKRDYRAIHQRGWWRGVFLTVQLRIVIATSAGKRDPLWRPTISGYHS